MVQSAVRPIRVLAIDDSPEFFSSLQSFLRPYTIFILSLILAQELRPDLVLMDLQMAGMNGWMPHRKFDAAFPKCGCDCHSP